MSNTDSLVEVTQGIVDLLTTNQSSLGIKKVFYGDQQLLPETPVVCVESGSIGRDMSGAPFRTQNSFMVFILVYHSNVQDTQKTRKQADVFAERIVALLHQNLNIGGLVIHGYATSLESAYAHRGGEMLRASRITWEGVTKTRIGG